MDPAPELVLPDPGCRIKIPKVSAISSTCIYSLTAAGPAWGSTNLGLNFRQKSAILITFPTGELPDPWQQDA